MKNVLLVDDDKILLTVLGNLLRGAGLQVHPATDVNQAIRLLKQHQFDLILTDANMPSLSGFDLLEIIKRNEAAYGYPKIIMLTGRTGKRDEDHAKLWGAHRFITKPADPSYVKELVVDMLELTKVTTPIHGIEVRDIARWTGAFEITQVFEEKIIFRANVPIPIGTQITIGSSLLNAISPTLSNVQVTGCTADTEGVGFTLSAKFCLLSESDAQKMRDWIERERSAA